MSAVVVIYGCLITQIVVESFAGVMESIMGTVPPAADCRFHEIIWVAVVRSKSQGWSLEKGINHR